ncbi:hypothetical protein D3C86_2000740 [compost metagenome]
MLVRARVGAHGIGRRDEDFVRTAFELFHRFGNELVEGNGAFLLAAIEQLGANPRWCDLDQLDAVFAQQVAL